MSETEYTAFDGNDSDDSKDINDANMVMYGHAFEGWP